MSCAGVVVASSLSVRCFLTNLNRVWKMIGSRTVCTAENPWNPKLHRGGVLVFHRDVREFLAPYDTGVPATFVIFECRNCGHRWTDDLAL